MIYSAVAIQNLCAQYNIKPTKQMGQNFLVSEKVAQKIVESVEITPKDTVIEIGAGFGAITHQLVQTNAKIIAIEKDRRLAEYLENTYGHLENFTLINKDALKVKVDDVLKNFGLQSSQSSQKNKTQNYKLIGNLPYSITSPLLEHYLEKQPRPTSATFMIQKEVAERIRSKPPKLQKIGLTMQTIGQVKKILRVSPHQFWPQPEVSSEVFQIKIFTKTQTTESQLTEKQFTLLQKISQISFAQKRKQSLPTLTRAKVFSKEKLEQGFVHANIHSTARPEQIFIAQWHKLVVYLDH